MYTRAEVLDVINKYQEYVKKHPMGISILQDRWLEVLRDYMEGKLSGVAKWWVERHIGLVQKYGYGTPITDYAGDVKESKEDVRKAHSKSALFSAFV